MRPTPAPLALALSVLAFAAQAQTADNPVTGKALFENTALASGNAGLPSCTSCHGSVEARRSQISGTGDSFADITFDTAMTRFTAALATQPDMRPLRVLTNQQVRDIAAYVAANRTATTPFDIVAEGATPGDRPDEAAATIREWAAAGATWWIEALWNAESPEAVWRRVAQGPPRLS